MQLLIQLELSKFKRAKKYIIFSVLITIGMCLFTTISLFAIEQDKATNYTEAIKMMNAAIIDCYPHNKGNYRRIHKKNSDDIVYLLCQQMALDDGKGIISSWNDDMFYVYYRTYQYYLSDCGRSIYETVIECI